MNKKENYRLRLAAPVLCWRAAAILCSGCPSAGGLEEAGGTDTELAVDSFVGEILCARAVYISLIASCSRTRPRVRGDGPAQ
jgi:hypothetical protein